MRTYADDVLTRLLVRVDEVDGFLDVAEDHVHVAVVGLCVCVCVAVVTVCTALVFGQERERRTWRTPLSSRSPRSLTKTRSERDTRMRSKGSAIWAEAILGPVRGRGGEGQEPRRRRAGEERGKVALVHHHPAPARGCSPCT